MLKRVRGDVKPKPRPKTNKTPPKVQSPVGKKPRGRPPKSKQIEEPVKKSAPKKRTAPAKKQTTPAKKKEKPVKKEPVVKKTPPAKFNIEGAVI